jgi:putative DNA primase/helicase
MADAIEPFKTAMQAYGLNPPDTIQPGKFHRFSGIDKKRGDDAGWCKLFNDGCGGVFGDFSAGLDEHWQCATEHASSDEERQAFRQRCKAECKARHGTLNNASNTKRQ